MSAHRRLAHSKRGMSTIFGGLFMVILILMGFNVMLWGFVQFDAYNRVITNMSELDRQATSENLVPVNPGCAPPCNTLDIIVNNLGGTTVTIGSIYIFNVSPTNSQQCKNTPCIVNPGISGTYFTNGVIPPGVINFQIHVRGITVNDGSGYRIALASTRGRLYTLYYPWPVNAGGGGGGGGQFVTNIGPLALYYNFQSFNYTTGTQTTSQSAFCLPASSSVILWVKIANTSPYDVKLLTNTGIQAQAYGVSGFGQFVQAWVEDNRTINPSALFAYNYATNPYDLAPAGPNGPTAASFAIVKFGAGSEGGTGSASFGHSGHSWITFIGFYYLYQGEPQGQTIPFMDFVTNDSGNCIA